MKNYVCFVNDNSGSMGGLAKAAAADFNSNIEAVKNAATQEMLDTVVSAVSIDGSNTRLTITVSNPHVLKPITDWHAGGGTPLWTGMAKLIAMLKNLPDINNSDVSVLVMITTDGEATDQNMHANLRSLMAPLLATGRWTFVARVPRGIRNHLKLDLLALGIPEGNIQQWDTTAAGMAASTAVSTQAVGNYFRSRTAGLKSSSSFYADASKVDITALEDISKKVSLYVVPADNNGIEIRPFILSKRMEYLKGSAFYQLTKTEAKVGYDKQILVRDRASGKVFHGKEARQMIGLPTDRNARLHPGDHKNFDLFIQSFSVNRKLVAGTGVLYWAEIGVPFTEADLAYLKPKEAAPVGNANPVVQLPAVPVSTTPTKSPIPVTPRAPQFYFFETREDARMFCAGADIRQSDILRNPTGPKGKRWSIPANLVKAGVLPPAQAAVAA